MKLLTKEQHERLLQQGRESAAAIAIDGNTPDHFPVVKLFTPDAGATWLLTEIDPDDQDTAFGLCDLGYPELGSVSLSEIAAVRGRLGLAVERDLSFRADKPLSAYAEAARVAGFIKA